MYEQFLARLEWLAVNRHLTLWGWVAAGGKRLIPTGQPESSFLMDGADRGEVTIVGWNEPAYGAPFLGSSFSA
ncbi:hypothetical protein CW304_33070 [Bacillus sp. UFRGS-B20]|nr:hypothetical protein CW304_33070 [Bacillus sp. UFRGS-B20]